MNFVEILLGQVPEAIYFALFMILSKNLTTKRLLFTILNIIEYILLFIVFPFNIWSHVLYFIITYILLKVLYKEKAQITDIFTLGISSLLMIIISIPTYFIVSTFTTYTIIGNLVQKLFIFLALYLLRKQLPKIQNIYKKLWNRNDKIPKRIKSTTFRAINVVIFNFMFYIINICLLAVAILKNWR